MSLPIIVINLDRDVERMAHMQAQLDRLSLAYERFPALRGDNVPSELARYFPFGVDLSPGEIGCYASHLAIMQRVARGEWSGPLLVLEDDVGLPADLPAVLDALARALPAQWDIVRLSYHTKRVSRLLAPLGANRHLVRYSQVPTTTGAYLISASGARKFLVERPRYLPIDHDLKHVWEWDLDTYGVSPPPINHDVLDHSTIDALSPAGRARARRNWNHGPAMPFTRLRRGVQDFGLLRLLALSVLDAAARLTPKPLRAPFVQWASARLA